MEADLRKALEASRAEHQARDGWQERYADLEQQIEELSYESVSSSRSESPTFAWRFLWAGLLIGLGFGVVVSVCWL